MLVTLFSDGTLALPGAHDSQGELRLYSRMETMRSLMSSPPEEGIAVLPAIPLGGDNPYDHVLPATLSFLEVSGDLAPYGWRIGPGMDAAWRAAVSESGERLEAARMGFMGYEGPLSITRLGPISLAMSVFMPSGERVLNDAGLVRELPALVSQAVAGEIARIQQCVPAAQPEVIVDERGALAAHEGRVPTVSGYRFHKPIGRLELTGIFGELISTSAATALEPQLLTLAIDARIGMIRAALDAGVRSLALNPFSRDLRAVGRGWEILADARERGVRIRFFAEPGALEATWRHVVQSWQQLGFAASTAQGFEIAVSRRAAWDKSHEPSPAAYIRPIDLDALIRSAARLADMVSA